MESDQLSLLVIHGLVSYLSTTIKSDEADCREVYILTINSFSLVIFSKYLKDIYFFVAFGISAYVQYSNTD
jgi:hypothetical protein